jgi:hypothetical protein
MIPETDSSTRHDPGYDSACALCRLQRGMRLLARHQARTASAPRLDLWRPGLLAELSEIALDVSVMALMLQQPGAARAHDAAGGDV